MGNLVEKKEGKVLFITGGEDFIASEETSQPIVCLVQPKKLVEAKRAMPVPHGKQLVEIGFGQFLLLPKNMKRLLRKLDKIENPGFFSRTFKSFKNWWDKCKRKRRW